MRNEAVINCADKDKLARAELEVRKLDARRGFQVEIRSINALIRGYIRNGELEMANEWFLRVLDPIYHASLGDIWPDRDTFHYLIQACTLAGDLPTAERHFG